MSKEIIKSLITAFLLFLIPLIYNQMTGGALIKFLGGLTSEERTHLEGRISELESTIVKKSTNVDGRISELEASMIKKNADVVILSVPLQEQVLQAPTGPQGGSTATVQKNDYNNISSQKWKIIPTH